MSTDPTREAVVAAVDSVVDPCSIATGRPVSIVEMGMLLDIRIDDGTAEVTLSVTSPVCWQAMNIIDAVQRAVGRVDGIDTAVCRIDPYAEWEPEMMDPEAQAALRRMRPTPNRRKLAAA